MDAQLEPSAAPPSVPQRTHWYANVIGLVPDQPPLVVVSVWPSTGDPETLGSEVLVGA
jgi:hypothetical protein